MSKRHDPSATSYLSLELYQPRPNILYSLDVAAHIAGVPRRSILVYCGVDLVQSVFQPPYGVMAFTEKAIRAELRFLCNH